MTLHQAVHDWATKAGFGDAQDFNGTSTPVGRRKNTNYAGFYLLTFDDDTFYIGESVNLRSRMGGHKTKWGNEITTVRFLPQSMSKQQLRLHEKKLIHALDRLSSPKCRNITHASVSAGVDELADLLSPEEQDQWLEDPAAFNKNDPTELKPMTPAQEVKYSTNARKFADLELATELTEALRTYLESCIPTPRRTEFQSWNVSTGTYGGRRAFCVSIGKMEAFTAFPDGSGFLVVRKSVLFPRRGDRARFMARFPLVWISKSKYADAGPDAVVLHAPSISLLMKLLADPTVRQAAAQLTIDVMRKHPSVYARYHCPQLVERVYADFTRPTPEPEAQLEEAEALPGRSQAATASPDMDEAKKSPRAIHTETGPEMGFSAQEVTRPVVTESVQEGVPVTWFVNAGPVKTKRNTVADFVKNGEWRMDLQDRYATMVQDMLPGEPIIVRKRRNTNDAPFNTRGHKVSVMDILLTGVVTENPGDGCSVKVDWDPRTEPRVWYLFTNQDPVWGIPEGQHPWSDRLVDFAVNGTEQDLDFWRNASYWRDRFGDR